MYIFLCNDRYLNNLHPRKYFVVIFTCTSVFNNELLLYLGYRGGSIAEKYITRVRNIICLIDTIVARMGHLG